MVLFGQKLFGQKLLYSCKSGCIRAKWLYLENKLLYSGKVVVFEQIGCIRAKLFYSVKVVVIGQSGSIRAKVVVFGQVGCFQTKRLCS